MKNMKFWRTALVATLVLTVMLSVTGGTIAWFTDSVTSAENKIQAGNLDVELYYQVQGQTDWTKVVESTNVFKADTLWEPGHTEVVKFKVVNEGNLALKAKLGVNVASETSATNKENKEFKLSDYIKFGVVDGEQSYDRDQAVAAVDANAVTLATGYLSENQIELKTTNASEIVTMVVYMPTTVGNEANYIGTQAPVINLGVKLEATQLMHESDSFNNEYDAAAPLTEAVSTVAEANAMIAGDKIVALVNCNEPNGILNIPQSFTGKLILNNVNIASIQAENSATIEILGKVVVKATGDGQSAITGTKLNITGSGNLTAVGKGDHGYGIGGDNAQSINISGITIDSVKGGHEGETGTDFLHYKNAPEGGAAIGSGKDGAVITLNNVTVINAVGGSKAAAIGARHHTGVTVNINNSTIVKAMGGVSAAGIGGSRVSNGATESGTTVNITNSNVTAMGGVYGAGIGSGYDTHCQAVQPLCIINITDSTINATGGKYAAGVGTGYHNAALAGEIKNSTVTAVSGEKYYKDAYSKAMDVGFGVVDPAREGQQTDSELVWNNEVIKLKF